MSLLKPQTGAFSVVIGVVTGHCIMGMHVRRIGLVYLASDFSRSCRNEEEEETGIISFVKKKKKNCNFMFVS